MVTIKADSMARPWDVRVVGKRAVLMAFPLVDELVVPMAWRMVVSLAETMECEKVALMAV